MTRKGFTVCLLLCVACGSTPAPPPASPEASGNQASQGENGAGSGAGGVEAERPRFMEGCINNGQSEEYCACGFEQFKEIFKDTDPSERISSNDPRMQEMARRVRAECASKIPEAQVELNFKKVCLEQEATRQAYCDCAWTTLRKSFLPSDIGAYEPGDPKWERALHTIPPACSGTYPPELAKREFMEACQSGRPEEEKRCGCMWSKLTAKYKIEEIAAGLAKIEDVPEAKRCK